MQEENKMSAGKRHGRSFFINLDESKELSNEELEQVSGGCWYETSNDSKFLNVLLRGTEHHRCDRYGKEKIAWGSDKNDIVDSWASLGISIKRYGATSYNEYYLDGKPIIWIVELFGRHKI